MAGKSNRLPDFIGVGPPRTATTWLHQALTGHVGLPEAVKETNFFRWQYDKGLEWYKSLFANCPDNVPIGEFSPNYFAAAEARERIASDIPNCKIVITLRDPVERLYSNYRKMYEQAYFTGTFEESLELRPDLLEWSCYARHVRAWQEQAGTANVLVLIHDDLKRDAQEFLNQVCRFIGVEEIPLGTVPGASERVNAVPQAPRSRYLAMLARRAKDRLERRGSFGIIRILDNARLRRILFAGGRSFAPLHPETAATLRRQFEPEVAQLEQVIGRDLSGWRHATL